MGTPVRFTPLMGAQSEAPLCYFLEVGDVKFLLDCGWDEGFDTHMLESMVRSVVSPASTSWPFCTNGCPAPLPCFQASISLETLDDRQALRIFISLFRNRR